MIINFGDNSDTNDKCDNSDIKISGFFKNRINHISFSRTFCRTPNLNMLGFSFFEKKAKAGACRPLASLSHMSLIKFNIDGGSIIV